MNQAKADKSQGGQPTFEAAIKQLEALLEQIESGEIGLEAALKHYEKGTALIKHCRGILDTTEKRIAELTITGPGGLAEAGEEESEAPSGESADEGDEGDEKRDEDVPF